MPINEKHKEILIYSYSGIVQSNKVEQTTDTCKKKGKTSKALC